MMGNIRLPKDSMFYYCAVKSSFSAVLCLCKAQPNKPSTVAIKLQLHLDATSAFRDKLDLCLIITLKGLQSFRGL